MSLADVFKRVEEQKQTEIKADFFCRAKPRIEIIPPMKTDTVVRASDLPYFCAREEMLRAILNVKRVKEVSLKEQIRMARGTAMHRLLQNEILPRMKAIGGWWMCHACINRIRSEGHPGECRCGRKELEYEEFTLKDETHGITGHADGLWFEDDSLWEIKTCEIGTYQRVIADGPPKAHKVQAGAYLSMWKLHARMHDWPEVHHVRYLYIPMVDVSEVRIPAPVQRKVPFEYDYDTGMITFKIHEAEILPFFEDALREVMTFRSFMESMPLGKLLPMRREECPALEVAARWKYGCSMAEACFKYETMV